MKNKDLVGRGFNMNWANDNDRELLRKVAFGEGMGGRPADFLVGVEGRDRANNPVKVQKLLDEVTGAGTFKVFQNLSDSAKSGSVIAVRRRGGVRVISTLLRVLSRQGKGVQTRYLRTAMTKVKVIRARAEIGVGHNPLKSSNRQGEGMSSINRFVASARIRVLEGIRKKRSKFVRWFFFGDVNHPPREVAKDNNAPNWSGHDVMLAMWSAGWGEVKTRWDKIPETDHAVFTFIVTLPKKRSKPKKKKFKTETIPRAA